MDHRQLFVLITIICILLVVPISFLIMILGTRRSTYKKLAELNDCPFKFSLKNEYVVFNLNDAKLYCEFSFGIRSDGTYGVKELVLNSINGTYGGRIDLKLGQSIYPIISRMKEFECWTSTKIFKTKWDKVFRTFWDYTIQSLDNLKYLEQKYEEKNK